MENKGKRVPGRGPSTQEKKTKCGQCGLKLSMIPMIEHLSMHARCPVCCTYPCACRDILWPSPPPPLIPPDPQPIPEMLPPPEPLPLLPQSQQPQYIPPSFPIMYDQPCILCNYRMCICNSWMGNEQVVRPSSLLLHPMVMPTQRQPVHVPLATLNKQSWDKPPTTFLSGLFSPTGKNAHTWTWNGSHETGQTGEGGVENGTSQSAPEATATCSSSSASMLPSLPNEQQTCDFPALPPTQPSQVEPDWNLMDYDLDDLFSSVPLIEEGIQTNGLSTPPPTSIQPSLDRELFSPSTFPELGDIPIFDLPMNNEQPEPDTVEPAPSVSTYVDAPSVPYIPPPNIMITRTGLQIAPVNAAPSLSNSDLVERDRILNAALDMQEEEESRKRRAVENANERAQKKQNQQPDEISHRKLMRDARKKNIQLDDDDDEEDEDEDEIEEPLTPKPFYNVNEHGSYMQQEGGKLPPYIKDVLRTEREFLHYVRKNSCKFCLIKFKERKQLFQHLVHNHYDQVGKGGTAPDMPSPLNINLAEAIFGGAYRQYMVDLTDMKIQDLNIIFRSIRDQYNTFTQNLQKELKCYKIQFEINPHFVKKNKTTKKLERTDLIMRSYMYTVENQHFANFAFRSARDSLAVRIEEFEQLGSMWCLEHIGDFKILILEFNPFTGGTRSKLPLVVAYKHRNFIDVPSGESNHHCFLHTLMAAKWECELPKEDTHRRRTLRGREFYQWRYKRVSRHFNLKGINFPFNVNQAAKFERQNPDFALNIYSFDDDPTRLDPINSTVEEVKLNRKGLDKAYKNLNFEEKKKAYHELRDGMSPHHMNRETRKHMVDILIVQDGDVGHYLWITNLLGMMRYPGRNSKMICRFCLTCFDRTAEGHDKVCAAKGLMRTDMPEDSHLEFNSYSKTIPHLFLGSADFESRLAPMKQKCGNSTKIAKHEAVSYAYAISDREYNLVNHNHPTKAPKLKSYFAESAEDDVALKLIEDLLEEAREVDKKVYGWNLTANANQEKHCENAPPFTGQPCGFCGKDIIGKPARHHSHYPPYSFEHWSCAGCNVNAKTNGHLIIMVHNLSNYDSSFILKACAHLDSAIKVKLIGKSIEKIFSISIGPTLTFLDSRNFLPNSLEKITATLNKTKDFVITRQHFMKKFDNNVSKVELMLQKGIYPYSFFQTMENYEEPRLPFIDKFTNDLTGEPCSVDDYKHAQNVFDKLGMKNLRDYTLAYVEQDVTILLDAFNNFRKIFYQQFQLDPAHFYSLPHLSWSAALKESGASLEYMKDPTMLMWVESSIRGGMSTGSELRCAVANNPYLPSYDDKKPTTYLMAFDLVNLYGHCLSKLLPVGEFKWMEQHKIEKINKEGRQDQYIRDLDPEGSHGYTLEVDMMFPEDIQEKMLGLTPVPTHRKVQRRELAPMMRGYADALGISDTTLNAKRLITDFYPKFNYVISYRCLQYYVSLGIKVTKIHKGISYKQKRVLRSYIQKLAKMRKDATSDFERDLWKLSANAVFGKSVENVRDRASFIMVRSREQALRYNKKPTVASVHFLDCSNGGEIALLRMKRLSVKLDKPIYLGATVLDEAKRKLYKWYYSYALPKWNVGGKQKFWTIGSDTDSIYCLVETDDIYADIFQDKKKFDMSVYKKDDPIWGRFYDGTNEKKPGKMKDENAGFVMTAMIYLRPKSYCFTVAKPALDANMKITLNSEKTVAKSKGIPKHIVNTMTMKAFQEALEFPVQHIVTSTGIVKRNHTIFTMFMARKGLSGFDMKRYIVNEWLSYPFGYFRTTNSSNVMIPEEPKIVENLYCYGDEDEEDEATTTIRGLSPTHSFDSRCSNDAYETDSFIAEEKDVFMRHPPDFESDDDDQDDEMIGSPPYQPILSPQIPLSNPLTYLDMSPVGSPAYSFRTITPPPLSPTSMHDGQHSPAFSDDDDDTPSPTFSGVPSPAFSVESHNSAYSENYMMQLEYTMIDE